MYKSGWPATLLLNAGGNSRRMGRDKALLPVPGSQEPLIRHVARRLLPLTEGDLVVVANDPAVYATLEPLQPRLCLADAYPDTGPLGGLATALQVCQGWVICVACDLPLVQPPLFHHLCRLAAQEATSGSECWDAVVPQAHGRRQTLHALYHRRCLPAIRHQLAAGHYRMDGFLVDVRVRFVGEETLRRHDPTLRSFFNVNTPQDWAQASRWLCEEREV